MRACTTWGLIAALCTGGFAAAQTQLHGPVNAGVFTCTGDLLIYDLDVHAGPNGETTLLITVTDGNIDVGDAFHSYGIHAMGKDGLNGVSGQTPTPGEDGGGGFGIVLKTVRTPTGNAAGLIRVNKGIDCSGGNGGNAGNGASGTLDENCVFIGGVSAEKAGQGGEGGTIEIQAAGSIYIVDLLDVTGGNGGYGGSGGNGFLGAPGFSTRGGTGGAGGRISLSHTTQAPKTAECQVTASWANPFASLAASGGNGGIGGTGATGSGAANPGGNGGEGGAGGKITVATKDFGMSSQTTGFCSAETRGGSGGPGGPGGYGNDSAYIMCNGSCLPAYASAGANSGTGGDGGIGGAIDITVPHGLVGLGTLAMLRTNGGNGAMSGQGGAGGVDRGTCSPRDPCTSVAYAAGTTFPSGDGADAGAVSIACKTLTMGNYPGQEAWIIAHGGNGAQGQNAGAPGAYCCGNVRYSLAGSQGGNAGQAGSGANVAVNVTTFLALLSQFDTCGGDGARGGKGSTGIPVGVGGLGTPTGTAGSLILNGVGQPNQCVPGQVSNGDTGDPLPGCFE